MGRLKIGWIGTGVMGNAMCGHMLNAGHNLFIHNRSKAKCANLLEKGACWCDTPKQVAQRSEVVFSIVGYPQDVSQVMMGGNGVLEGIESGSVIVEMTTSSPGLAIAIYEKAAAKGVAALDAPVSGGDVGAREAGLVIMVGGDKDAFMRVRPLLALIGKKIEHMGPPGSGQHTKMCNQILVAGNMMGAVEAMLYAHRTGMDLKTVINVIGQGAASSWAINHLGPRIAEHDFKPGFYIKHFVKDMGIALNECRRMNLSLPGLSLVQQFYLAAMAQGDENLGTQGLYKVLARLNGLD